MSLAYAGGNRSVAIANITAAVRARITTGADGVKVLNTESLIDWLLGQLQQLQAEAVAPATADSVQLAANRTDPRPLVEALNGSIGKAAFSSRADWPQSARSALNEAQVAAVKTAQAELKSLSQSVTNYYNSVFSGSSGYILQALAQFYDSQGLDAKVPAGVVRLVENRSYIVTFVTDWNEESAPSAPSELVELDQNDTIVVTRPPIPPGRHITHWRAYRSNSSSTAAAFQYISNPNDEKGVPIDVETTQDGAKAAELQEVCPTTTWSEPPANLSGLVGMPNGMMAGFYDNTVAFCEPYHGYAWPEAYRKTTEHPIVGLGVWGTTVFVGTRGWPYFMQGSDSASVSAQKIQTMQACVSARSIVALEQGVVYASPDGLCLANLSGVTVVTKDLWSREDWQALGPETIVGAAHDGCYTFLWGNGSGCYMIDLDSGKLVTIDAAGSTLYNDLVTDTLYLGQGPRIVGLFAGAGRRVGRWRTPRIVMPKEVGMAWAKVLPGRNGAGQELAEPATLRLYAEGELVDTLALEDKRPERLPFVRELEYELEIESTQRLVGAAVTSTTEEMQSL